MRKFNPFFLSVFLLLVNGSFAQEFKPDSLRIKGDVERLAATEMGGRGIDDSSYFLAAEFIAKRLFDLGAETLKPSAEVASEWSDFWVPVPMRREKLNKVELTLGGVKLKFGKDFYTNRSFEEPIFADKSMAFVPEKLLETVKPGAFTGKIVLYIRSNVKGKKSPTPREISRVLQKTNARAVFIVDYDYPKNTTEIITRLLEARTTLDNKRQLANGVTLETSSNPTVVMLSPAAAKKAFKKSGFKWNSESDRTSVENVEMVSVPVQLKAEVSKFPVDYPNVAGVFKGGKNPTNYVVVSAHLDHLGTHFGKMYPGADDNGSGSATLLELARLYAERRTAGLGSDNTVIFLWFTGEESGLLGSQYFVEHAPIPVDRILANLNVDMIGRADASHKVDQPYLYLVGSDKLSTELHRLSEEVNNDCCQIELDYTYNDPADPHRYYYRSDHYNFAKNGIPCIFYFSGVHADYHQPSDTADKLDYQRIARNAQLIFETSLRISNLEAPFKLDVK